MSHTNIEIDLITGEIILLASEGRETLSSIAKRMHDSLKQSVIHDPSVQKSYILGLDGLYLDNNEVSLSVNSNPKILRVNIYPPPRKTHEETEACASKIAQAIESIWPEPDFSMNKLFQWGELTIRTEWRDGGYGAEFSYK